MANEISVVLIVILIVLCVCMLVTLWTILIGFTKLGDKYLDLLRMRNARHDE